MDTRYLDEEGIHTLLVVEHGESGLGLRKEDGMQVVQENALCWVEG